MTDHGGRRDARILVVDDDEQLAALLVLVLEGEGYPVIVARDAAGAIDEVRRGTADLVVLDISLGADDGRMVLSQIREIGELPVILISGKGETADRVLGLRLGADDFLAKPFSPVELVARVESVLRRDGSVPASQTDNSTNGPVGGLTLDPRTREVHVDGRAVELTAKEFDLLAFLTRSPRQVFSRGQLLEHCGRRAASGRTGHRHRACPPGPPQGREDPDTPGGSPPCGAWATASALKLGLPEQVGHLEAQRVRR